MKMTRRTALLSLAAAWSLSVFAPLDKAHAGDDPRSIMAKWAESRKLDGSEAVVKMIIDNGKGGTRIREMSMATKLYDGGKTEKRVYRFLAPADVKGTGVLVFDYENKADDVWVYMPALRKTRRIVSSSRSKGFMGSEFSYGDLNVPELDNYTYKLLKTESVSGANCWVIEVTPKNEQIAKEDGYAKKHVWIEQSNHALRKGMFFDKGGKPLKRLISDNVKLVDPKKKKYRAMRMEMINEQNGRKSIFETTKISFAPNTKDEYFTTGYLERP